MSKILVTGGLGYIGSHTVVELYESGYTPIIVDNLSNSSVGILEQLTAIVGQRPPLYLVDLCERDGIAEVLREHPDISGVIHFAAFKAVGESVREPLKYYYNNLLSLTNLLEAFSDQSVNFVFSSSCTVYGQPDRLPVSENAPVKKATSAYGHTKQVAEEILAHTVVAHEGLRVISLRYFNPAGAHESGLIGELPIGVPQNLVPLITQSAVGKRGPLTVFGTDYNTPDGSAIRDYIHVVDLSRAHVAALRLLESGNPNGRYDVFNVGTGRGYSVLEVIRAFEQATGAQLAYRLGERRVGDIEQVWSDVRKSETELGWKAEKELADMMLSAWKWQQYLEQHAMLSSI